MIEFKTYFTGSSGNLHTCTDGYTKVALDFGVPFRQAQKALDYNLSPFDGILSGHRHRDHCLGLPGAIKACIDCYATTDVFESLRIKSHRAHIIKPMDQFRVGS